MQHARLVFLMELVNAGKAVLMDRKPTDNIFTIYSRWTEYSFEPGEEACSGVSEYTDDNITVSLSSSWPLENCSYRRKNGKAVVHRCYDRNMLSNVYQKDHAWYTVEFDRIPVFDRKTGDARWLTLSEIDEWTKTMSTLEREQRFTCISPIPTHYVKFLSEEVFREYCEYEYEMDDGHASFFTEAQWIAYQKKQEEEERQEKFAKMNQWTKEFCAKHDVSMYSTEFLEALQEHLDERRGEWDRRIEGAREDGLCIGMGVTVDQWYDHMDGLQIGRDRVLDFSEDVWAFCEEQLPLLVAQYHERKGAYI